MGSSKQYHGAEGGRDDRATQESNGGVSNTGRVLTGSVVFDEEVGSDEDEGAEHLDELSLAQALSGWLQVGEIRSVDNLVSVDVVEDHEEDEHASEGSTDLSENHVEGLESDGASTLLSAHLVEPHSQSDSGVQMSSSNRSNQEEKEKEGHADSCSIAVGSVDDTDKAERADELVDEHNEAGAEVVGTGVGCVEVGGKALVLHLFGLFLFFIIDIK